VAKEKDRGKFAEDLLGRLRRHPGEVIAIIENFRESEDFGEIETGITLGVIPEGKDDTFFMDLQGDPLTDLVINVPSYVHCSADEAPELREGQVKVLDVHDRYEEEIATEDQTGELVRVGPDRPPLALTILVGNEEVSKLDPQILEPAAKLLRIKLPLPA